MLHPATEPSMRRVAVIGLGGTIAMTTSDRGGVAPDLSADQLVAAAPGLADAGIEFDVVDFRRLPGASLTISDLHELVAIINEYLCAGVDGVVVTQGTDTLEETAYLVDLLHEGPQPVVFTGAMRNPTLASPDGPANLLAAVTVAADRRLRDQGCVVVLAEQIHAARRVRKSHSTSTSAFTSPDGGPLGYLVEGTPHLVNRLTTRFTLPSPDVAGPPLRVGLYTATLADDATLLTAWSGQLDGLIVAGFGVGHVPQEWLPVLTDLAGRIPVVLASRTGAGPVLSTTYGFPGSETDLLHRGLIPGGLLGPYKARILLQLALQHGADHIQITAAFAAAGSLSDPHAWPWPDAEPSPSTT